MSKSLNVMRNHAPASPALAVRQRTEVRTTPIQLVATQTPHPALEELIREAAFHRAEARGFVPGYELEDWLVAEAEVNQRMNGEGRAY